ncbi:PROTEIN PLASTID MOVEMENT IMPAIRED 1 [Salix koriyanagi]|uniref:PROTEIN PLASTID MOVEMENT IMPAIRED 1 n=1 Tax=Salix koriyanagi TaxID=2511006 RepID=A0A9Q0SK97_9ROSI|nr:PROTEIN PLASTID MOVEMENT IMPAIRED 1 [Salix koriyanagi]
MRLQQPKLMKKQAAGLGPGACHCRHGVLIQKPHEETERQTTNINQPEIKKLGDRYSSAERKGIWNWKPIRAISHIGMQKLSCLFSVEVVAVQGLPASMNGLRLSVCVRKKEAKDGAVNTMPSRVSQGAADFEETLFIKCHVYCTPGNGKQLKFEQRPFFIYVFAVDAEALDFGRTSVDLSELIQESMEKSQEGARVRQWDTSFNLSGKAKGGELVLKLGFQIMEKEGGIDIYSHAEGSKTNKLKIFSSSFGRKQSKSSFSVSSPRMTLRSEAWTPSQTKPAADIQGMDDLNLDETAPVPPPSSSVQKSEEPGQKIEDLDLPDFEIVDKGVEIQDKEENGDAESEENMEEKSQSSEVVKEIVHDQIHLTRLTELDSIAQQIKALESMMGEEKNAETDDETTESQKLDADEETVYLSELGKGLGCVVQTRDGGYLAATNPLDTIVSRKDTPKLAMQLSKALVIQSDKSINGFELFQRMASSGFEELSSQILSLMPLDELLGKTAEQIAFEGIASAIIQGRNKEGASSSAARTIAAVKTMATAMSAGRKERISTGIWNVNENPLTAEEVLAFSLQKIEVMAIEALKIQAEMAEEDAPFDVSPLTGKARTDSGNDQNHPLASTIPLEDWIKKYSLASPGDQANHYSIAVVVQLRDPIRRYEAVGGPVVAVVHATQSGIEENNNNEEKKFKVTSLHVGGMKGKSGRKRNLWDSERQRLTASQWLVAYGLGKAGKKGKHVLSKGQDLLWSISSRIMADMWLKPMRNPDVKFTSPSLMSPIQVFKSLDRSVVIRRIQNHLRLDHETLKAILVALLLTNFQAAKPARRPTPTLKEQTSLAKKLMKISSAVLQEMSQQMQIITCTHEILQKHWLATAYFRSLHVMDINSQRIAIMSFSDEQMLVDSDGNHIAMTCEWHVVSTDGLDCFPINSCHGYAGTSKL